MVSKKIGTDFLTLYFNISHYCKLHESRNYICLVFIFKNVVSQLGMFSTSVNKVPTNNSLTK